VRQWLARHPRWAFHFTPTSASWLNAVEGFFTKLTKRRLKRGVFVSVVDLQAAINRFVVEHNAETKPFTWTADPNKIIRAAVGAREVNVREVINAIFYVLSTSCQWNALPKDLPPKSTVHDYFILLGSCALQRIHEALYLMARELAGREASPTAAIIDRQSAKAAQKGALDWTGMDMMRARKSPAANATSSSTRSEAQAKVAEEVKMPPGSYLAWGGQFENFSVARQRIHASVRSTIQRTSYRVSFYKDLLNSSGHSLPLPQARGAMHRKPLH
jgi:transposase